MERRGHHRGSSSEHCMTEPAPSDGEIFGISKYLGRRGTAWPRPPCPRGAPLPPPRLSLHHWILDWQQDNTTSPRARAAAPGGLPAGGTV